MFWPLRRRARSSSTQLLLAGLLALCGASLANADEDPLPGRPVVAKNADSHLEVFRVEPDGQLRHRWQKVSNGEWSAWSSLGDAFAPGFAVVCNSAAQLEVFAVDRATHQLRHAHQIEPNSTDWSAWSDLGGPFAGPVAVVPNAKGQLEVFAVAADTGTVRHCWQTNGTASWSGWSDLGGPLLPELAAVRNRDGHLELFGLAPADHALLHCWQQDTNRPMAWSPWTRLGGSLLPGFAVGPNVLGRMEAFGIDRTSHGIQRTCQTTPGKSEHWTDWQDFSGELTNAPTPPPAADAAQKLPDEETVGRGSADTLHPTVTTLETGLAVGLSAEQRLEVFAIDTHGATLLHRWETLAPDVWSRWASMGIAAKPYPAVTPNEDGNLELFVMDLNDPSVLHHRRQISQASDWLDWSSLDAPSIRYRARTWQTDAGLPHNVVQALAQTRDGYIWIGTLDGLARFDGLNFTVFNPTTTPELPQASITALCAARDGSLWIGMDGGGLARLKDGAFTHYGTGSGLAGVYLRAIYETRDGSLWLGTTTGMSRYRDGKFTTYNRRNGLLSDVVRSLHEDRTGHLWIATGEGLNRLSGDAMDAFLMPNNLPNDSVRCIWQDNGGRIWIGSNNGMLWYNWFWTRSFYAYNSKYGLSDTFVSAICDDREGNLWVGTYSGLNRFHEGRFYPELNNDGVPFDKVNALLEDHEGNLWVGCRDGLSCLTPQHFDTYTRQQGLTHNNVMSVLQDQTGSVWAGTWGGGLNEIKDDKVTAYLTTGANAANIVTATTGTNRFPESLVLSLCETRDGSLWVGADFDGGLARLKHGKLTRYTWKDGLINAPVRVIHQDRTGALWVGTSAGLCRFQNGKFTRYTVTNQLASDTIRAICEDHAGRLWFGTETGLSLWDNGRFITYTTRDGLSDNRVLALYEDPQQNLWVGTAAGGLNLVRLQGSTNVARFPLHPKRFTTEQGLFSNEIFEVLEDDFTWLWMTCSKGIFRVRKQDFFEVEAGNRPSVACIAYGHSDGLGTTQCNGIAKPAGWKGRDGRLWFPTSKGLVSIDPAALRVSSTPPRVFIEQVLADKKVVLGAHGDCIAGNAPKAPTAPLSIAPGRGELEFHFTALDFQSPDEVHFRYQLDNVDSEWFNAGTHRVATYHNLAPGHYRFRVVACSKEGVWNEVGPEVEIVLQPHLWQTWWYRGSAALLVIGAAGAAGRYVTRRRMQRRLRVLEQRHAIEKERGRIAKDIHDDLGSSLTRIMMLGERAEDGLGNEENVGPHVGKIVSIARGSLQALDEIVWAVNPENDTLEGLVEYISHYADELFESTPLGCRLEIPVQLPHFTLSAEVRHDLFLTVKEAFNNILKHSKATEVHVEVSASHSLLQILIEDNGSGFDPQHLPAGRKGNGLGNMRKRIEALGGRLLIVSTPGQGARLSLTAPLAHDRRGER